MSSIAYPPPMQHPEDTHTHLMNVVHSLIGHGRVNAADKAKYTGVLNSLAQMQAQNHQQRMQTQRPAAGPGGPVAEPVPVSDPQAELEASLLMQRLFGAAQPAPAAVHPVVAAMGPGAVYP